MPDARPSHGAHEAAAPREHAQIAAGVVTALNRVIVGKPEVVALAVQVLLADGHLLIEDVPGVGKTLLARALARTIGVDEHRIQGTPDLLPADLTGSSVWRPDQGVFSFIPGPLFAGVVLVDEANRMPPRTQAALLEAMEERQVSVDGITHQLPSPHLVIATQNPVEQVGTSALPESELDRFTASTAVGYPDATAEAAMISQRLRSEPLESLTPLLDPAGLAELQAAVRQVQASRALIDYVVRLLAATRQHPEVRLGASPRAGLQMVRLAQAGALLAGRTAVLPDDVKSIAIPALRHRLAIGGMARDAEEVVRSLLHEVPVLT